MNFFSRLRAGRESSREPATPIPNSFRPGGLLALVVTVRESLADGDSDLAEAILAELEIDLVAARVEIA
jgi:hypothetical protein